MIVHFKSDGENRTMVLNGFAFAKAPITHPFLVDLTGKMLNAIPMYTPNYGVPSVRAFKKLIALLLDHIGSTPKKEPVEVAFSCQYGKGRTGTLLAAILKWMLYEYSEVKVNSMNVLLSTDFIVLVRQLYDVGAVESTTQMKWVDGLDFDKLLREPTITVRKRKCLNR